jgi:hypothetical protein
MTVRRGDVWSPRTPWAQDHVFVRSAHAPDAARAPVPIDQDLPASHGANGKGSENLWSAAPGLRRPRVRRGPAARRGRDALLLQARDIEPVFGRLRRQASHPICRVARGLPRHRLAARRRRRRLPHGVNSRRPSRLAMRVRLRAPADSSGHDNCRRGRFGWTSIAGPAGRPGGWCHQRFGYRSSRESDDPSGPFLSRNVLIN